MLKEKQAWKFILCIILIWLISKNSVASEYWPEQSSSAIINLSVRGGVVLENAYGVSRVEANVSMFPKNGLFQEVQLWTEPAGDKSNDSIIFSWQAPLENVLNYRIDAIVSSRRQEPAVDGDNNFPILSLPKEYGEYLSPGGKIVLGPEFSRLASEITNGSSSLFEAASRLNNWVSKNVEYDVRFGNVSYDSKWVLENRRGTCDEFAVLFIALCRAVGIPARYASGIAYSNIPGREKFESHAWAEVYFPGHGWIPFDPTYGESGYVDASHIIFLYSKNAELSPAIYSMKSEGGDLRAEMINISAFLIRRDELRDYLQISAEPVWKSICLDSYDVISAEIYNPYPYYIARRISLSRSEALSPESEEDLLIVLAPREKKRVAWLVRTVALEEGFIYSIPVSVYSSSNQNNSARILITAREGSECISRQEALAAFRSIMAEKSQRYKSQISVECPFQIIHLLENESIRCIIKNVGNTPLNGVSICSNGRCYLLNLSILQEFQLDFPADSEHAGNKSQKVSVRGEGILMSQNAKYEVIRAPKIRITDFGSEVARDKVLFSFKVIPEAGYAKIEDVLISAEGFPVHLDSENMTLPANLSAEVAKNILRRGKNIVNIKVTYSDVSGRAYSESENLEVEIKMGRIEKLFLDIESFFLKIFRSASPS